VATTGPGPERDAREGLSEELKTSDGALRQLEKSEAVAASGDAGRPARDSDGVDATGDGEVVPLGKYGGQGAPEEESADEAMYPPGAAGVGTPPVDPEAVTRQQR